jgi:hypothetical protein
MNDFISEAALFSQQLVNVQIEDFRRAKYE